MDNVRYPCWGVAGGRAGRTGAFILNPGTPGERVLPSIGDDIQIAAGDVLRVATCGGGGWGDPFDRDPEHVRRDVLAGFVSVQGARDDYGVVLDPETLRLDIDETLLLRGSQARPVDASASVAVAFDRGN